MMNVKFWGVRGSIPTPLSPKQVTEKVRAALALAAAGQPIPFEVESTYGGNTTCVEVNAGDQLYILDMGTGVRDLGKEQLKKLLVTKRLRGTILQSHVHWDHIQGLPFWAPMYLPRRQFYCDFDFYGGKQWDSKLDEVYRGQMDAPYFPVNLQELEQTAMRMKFHTIYDGWEQLCKEPDAEFPQYDDDDEESRIGSKCVSVLARKLNHPQETFGYRLTQNRKTLAFTTDHEPFAGDSVPNPLAELVRDADVWITDCQYSHLEYMGVGGPQKMGWGHSYPEYIARVARETSPKKIIITHHDPDSTDTKISELAKTIESQCKIETVAAFEGMELSF